MITMRYGKYIASVEFDQQAGILYGEVTNLHDVVTFQGRSVSELEQALKESIESYLNACSRFGKEPERPYTGVFQVRIRPEVHRWAVMAAQSEGKSLNKWVSEKLEEALKGEHRIANDHPVR
ncbi:MAG TPA: type II toxin-antitoxin system HicB family antitoxin [Syntrophobacter fumaroxidans]|nr:type II toxin-antitoxin system HicB family antitoxin [Syntrophobacter fumaroxidans]